LLGIFVALSVAGQASAATLSLSESTFAGWSIEAIVGNPGFQTGSQQPDGGNTGGNPDRSGRSRPRPTSWCTQ